MTELVIMACGAGGGALAYLLAGAIPRVLQADDQAEVYRCLPPLAHWPRAGWLRLLSRAALGLVDRGAGFWAAVCCGGLMALPVVWLFSGLSSVECIAGWVLGVILLCAALVDLRHGLLPDRLTFPLLWGGLLLALAGRGPALHSAVAGAAVGYILLWGTGWGFYLLTGREGLGYGDAKLAAVLGGWLGAAALPGCLLAASLLGLIYVAGLRVMGQRPASIPFGPGLALAGWGGWLYQSATLW